MTGRQICEPCRWKDYDEGKYNAILIAAAPDMYAALEKLEQIGEGGVIERIETGIPTWHALDEVKNISRAALAKARGES